MPLDIDECSSDRSPCDANADCANNNGSFSCKCRRGFIGNGTFCAGKFHQRYDCCFRRVFNVAVAVVVVVFLVADK